MQAWTTLRGLLLLSCLQAAVAPSPALHKRHERKALQQELQETPSILETGAKHQERVPTSAADLLRRLRRPLEAPVRRKALGELEGPLSPRNELLDAELKDAYDVLFRVRKEGPHRPVPSHDVFVPFSGIFASAPSSDWAFFGFVLTIICAMDFVVLQQLPETERTNVVLLVFWLLVALAVDAQVSVRLGTPAGVGWFLGYMLELMYSLDTVFVAHVLLCTMDTPRRLLGKVMTLALWSSVAFRLVYLAGLAPFLDSLKVLPYTLGTWLLYGGVAVMTAPEEEGTDVLQLPAVRALHGLLGSRFGCFYDEESEAFVALDGGKHRATLLVVVASCIIGANLAMGVDVAMVKAVVVPNKYLSFSSSVLALFTLRALFFVLRDIFTRFRLTKRGVGVVLLLLGVETLLGRSLSVTVLGSCAVVLVILVLSVCLSLLWDHQRKSPCSAPPMLR